MIKENFVKLISTYAIVSEEKPELYKKSIIYWYGIQKTLTYI